MKQVHTPKWAARCGWAFVLAAVALSLWTLCVPSERVVTILTLALASGVAGLALVALRFTVSVGEARMVFRAYGLRLYSGDITSSTEVDVAPTLQLGTTTMGWRRIDASTFVYFGGKGQAISVRFASGDRVFVRCPESLTIAEWVTDHIPT